MTTNDPPERIGHPRGRPVSVALHLSGRARYLVDLHAPSAGAVCPADQQPFSE